MDIKWLKEQGYNLEKHFSPEFIKSGELARQKSFHEMVEELKGKESRNFERLNQIKKHPLVELKGAIENLANKYKQDANALTLLGDLDKSRVYHMIADQLDQLLKA
ncbi:hypothetical protein RMB03_20640 [Acinetobacter sp. V91_7]|uniref:hypothetical protein n=1 Tax=unclassified Acinetobacter TaxID=196816 RepID=UPI00287D735E|nr:MULTISPECIES: hypothetical protein [unclassified Acinetobacter]MDS7933622.1 hypothetical protein [Acinetobacter sp. V91_4B]MDS7965356.1 hypothetical protein [Acinetobacter sp. V91_7]MDS8029185.1 hypothetical protein [Acinetobacter sp. V91_13]